MYHVIALRPCRPRSGAPYPPDLYVSRAELAAQVRMLAGAGYQAVTLGAGWVRAWHGRAKLTNRDTDRVLSFDDGYRSHITAARPILAARDAGPGC